LPEDGLLLDSTAVRESVLDPHMKFFTFAPLNKIAVSEGLTPRITKHGIPTCHALGIGCVCARRKHEQAHDSR
jgi:hypothetical protein